MIIPIKRKPIQGFKPRSATTVIKKQSVFGSAEIVTDPATAPPVVSAVAPVVNIRPVVTHPTAKPSVASASQQSSARSSVIRKIDTSALVHGAAPGAIGDYGKHGFSYSTLMTDFKPQTYINDLLCLG